MFCLLQYTRKSLQVSTVEPVYKCFGHQKSSHLRAEAQCTKFGCVAECNNIYIYIYILITYDEESMSISTNALNGAHPPVIWTLLQMYQINCCYSVSVFKEHNIHFESFTQK